MWAMAEAGLEKVSAEPGKRWNGRQGLGGNFGRPSFGDPPREAFQGQASHNGPRP